MRYQGQEDSLDVDISPSGLATGGARSLFDGMHAERRGFALDGEEIEILSVRVTAEWDAGFSIPSFEQSRNAAPNHRRPDEPTISPPTRFRTSQCSRLKHCSPASR
jgi:hypothetical protein